MREVDEQNLPASTRLTDAAGQALSLREPPFLVFVDVFAGRAAAAELVLTVATIRGPFGKALQVNGLEDLEDAQQMYAEITGQHR